MKKLKLLFLFIICFTLISFFDVQAEVITATTGDFTLCETDALKIFQIVGYIILMVKLVVPLIIIGLSIYELVIVVMSGEDKDFKAAAEKLIKRLIAGVIIFFIPTVVYFALSLVENASETNSKFEYCNECLLKPTGDTCEDYVDDFTSVN